MEETIWLNGPKDYVVCVFYTQDYWDHAQKIIGDLQALKLNYLVKGYEPVANWAAGTRIKPQFIEECLARFRPKGVLYVDADASIRQEPTLLDDIRTDMAVCMKSNGEIAVGTIYCRNTPATRRLVTAWREAEEECDPGVKDGRMFRVALGRVSGISFTVLPATYRALLKDQQSSPVIEHFAASKEKNESGRARRKRMRLAALLGGIAITAAGAYVAWA